MCRLLDTCCCISHTPHDYSGTNQGECSVMLGLQLQGRFIKEQEGFSQGAPQKQPGDKAGTQQPEEGFFTLSSVSWHRTQCLLGTPSHRQTPDSIECTHTVTLFHPVASCVWHLCLHALYTNKQLVPSVAATLTVSCMLLGRGWSMPLDKICLQALAALEMGLLDPYWLFYRVLGSRDKSKWLLMVRGLILRQVGGCV